MRASRRMIIGLGALWLTLPVSAGDAADHDALPDGLFEFLGMMVEYQGELIDPLSLGGDGAETGIRSDEPAVSLHNASGAERSAERAAENTDAAVAEEHPDER